MTIVVIATIALLISSGWAANKLLDWRRDSGWALVGGVASSLVFMGSIVGLIGCIICGFQWRASTVKANLLNKEYGTSYTQEDIFYASNMIDVIHELNRNRYEINGDLRRERDPQRDKYARKDDR